MSGVVVFHGDPNFPMMTIMELFAKLGDGVKEIIVCSKPKFEESVFNLYMYSGTSLSEGTKSCNTLPFKEKKSGNYLITFPTIPVIMKGDKIDIPGTLRAKLEYLLSLNPDKFYLFSEREVSTYIRTSEEVLREKSVPFEYVFPKIIRSVHMKDDIHDRMREYKWSETQLKKGKSYKKEAIVRKSRK